MIDLEAQRYLEKGCRLEETNPEQTIQDCKKAIKLNGSYEDAYDELAKAYIKEKDYSSAILTYKRAINLWYRSTYYNQIGKLYTYLNKYSLAKMFFQQAIRMDETNQHRPNSDYLVNLRKVNATLSQNNNSLYQGKRDNELGNQYFQAKDYKKAIYYYKNAIQTDKHNVTYLCNLGMTYHKLGKYSSAANTYTTALKYSPDSQQALFRRCENYYLSHDYNLASSDLYKLIKLSPSIPKYYAALGLVYYKQKRVEDAIRSYTKALSLTDDINVKAFRYSELADVYIRVPNQSMATFYYKKAIYHTTSQKDKSYYIEKLHEVNDDQQRPHKPSQGNHSKTTSKLGGLIGLSEIKKRIKGYVNTAKMDRVLGTKDSNVNLIFEGNNGTGKFTVAKLFSHALYKIGAIKSSKVVKLQVGERDEQNKIKSALGGILFIDAFLDLNTNDASKDITQLVADVNQYHNNLSVILAGNRSQVRDFLNYCGSEFTSRFKDTLHFNNYSDQECLQILQLMIKNDNLFLTDLLTRRSLKTDFLKAVDHERTSKKNSFSNGDYIRNIVDKLSSARKVRMGALPLNKLISIKQSNPKELYALTSADVAKVFSDK